MTLPIKTHRIHRLRHARLHEENDTLVVEEPLEIRVNGESMGVVMRTPGHDFELARGFLLSEGILPAHEIAEHLRTLRLDWARDEMGLEIPNVVDCALPGLSREHLQACRRQGLATASCGICGRASLERVRVQAGELLDQFTFSCAALADLTERITLAQNAFAATGGLHAAALFTSTAELFGVREDIGRHNAVDKIVGAALLVHQHPLSQYGLWVSGRLSFEMAQKALLAGIPFVVAVSAASALAVELGEECGMTLIGFLRDDQAVVYTGKSRLQ